MAGREHSLPGADSPLLARFSLRRIKDALAGCSSPRRLLQIDDGEIAFKKDAPSSPSVTVAVKAAATVKQPPPREQQAPVTNPAAEAADVRGSAAPGVQAPAKTDSAAGNVEEDAGTVCPRLFSGFAQGKQEQIRDQTPSEWLFSRTSRPASQSSSRAGSLKLLPLDCPAKKLESALAILSVSTPTDPQLALTTLRQCAAHHHMVLEPRLGEVVPMVLRHVRGPLPGLSHTATVLLADLLGVFGDSMAPHCQDRRDPDCCVVLQLLLRATTQGRKAFEVDGARMALRTLAQRLSPGEAADLLQPYLHSRHPRRVRVLAAELMEVVQSRREGKEGSGQ